MIVYAKLSRTKFNIDLYFAFIGGSFCISRRSGFDNVVGIQHAGDNKQPFVNLLHLVGIECYLAKDIS